jgi:hypothetical protein
MTFNINAMERNETSVIWTKQSLSREILKLDILTSSFGKL